jgi:hypothetical protein
MMSVRKAFGLCLVASTVAGLLPGGTYAASDYTIVGLLGSGPAAKGVMIGSGSFAAVEFSNTNYTEIEGVNDLGDIVGKVDSPKAPYRGFSRSAALST